MQLYSWCGPPTCITCDTCSYSWWSKERTVFWRRRMAVYHAWWSGKIHFFRRKILQIMIATSSCLLSSSIIHLLLGSETHWEFCLQCICQNTILFLCLFCLRNMFALEWQLPILAFFCKCSSLSLVQESNHTSNSVTVGLVVFWPQQKFGIKTAGLEDKSTACQMLVCYARELKEGFAPYTEQVVKLMVPLLKFYFHDLVRTAAAESLPYLLECAKIKGDGYLRQMWAFMCPEVLKAMSAEPEPEVQILIMDALARCIETLGVGCMTPDYFTELGTMLHDIIDTHKNRQLERQREYGWIWDGICYEFIYVFVRVLFIETLWLGTFVSISHFKCMEFSCFFFL